MTGRLLSISAAMWSRTAESAPKLETSAILSLKRSWIAKRIKERGLTPANSAASRAALSLSPNKAGSCMSIESLLERRHTDTPVGGKEVLLRAGPQIKICIDERFDRTDDFVRGESTAREGADRAIFAGVAAKCDLIGLGAGLFEAENSDVADMVMPAGIDAARNIDFEFTNLPRAGAISETLGDPLGDGNRAGGCKSAIIEPRAGDDVGHEIRIGGSEALRRESVVDDWEIIKRDMRQDDILLMRDPELVLRKPLRKA